MTLEQLVNDELSGRYDEPVETSNNAQRGPSTRTMPRLAQAAHRDDGVDEFLMPGPSLSLWRKVVPNSITLLATAVGMSSIVCSLDAHFATAVHCVIVAGVLDGLDGPVARALRGTSKFGAELDSLSDYVNFGVAPGITLYLWALRAHGARGWLVCLVYICTMACRLARFNAGVDFNASVWTRNFFMGVPAPAGAVLVVTPMALAFEFPDVAVFRSLEFVTASTLLVSFMLVSRVPTYSSKMLSRSLFATMSLRARVCVAAVVALVVALFVANVYVRGNVWLFGITWNACYALTWPFSYWSFRSASARERRATTAAAAATASAAAAGNAAADDDAASAAASTTSSARRSPARPRPRGRRDASLTR